MNPHQVEYDAALLAIDKAIEAVQRLPKSGLPVSAVAMYPVAAGGLAQAKTAIALAATQ